MIPGVTPTGATLYLRPIHRGNLALLSRLGGPGGPIAAMREIDEFTVDSPAALGVFIDYDTRMGTAEIFQRKLVRGLDVKFEMFAATSTFSGGLKSIITSTDNFLPEDNPGTGEVDGRLSLEILMPPNEHKYCFTKLFLQNGVQVSFKD